MALWQGKTFKTYSPIQMMSPKTGHQKFKGLFHLTTTHFTLPSLLPSVSFRLPNPLFHIYHGCGLLVPPRLVIQTQISLTYPRILCSPPNPSHLLSPTQHAFVALHWGGETQTLGLLQTQSQRLLAVPTHPRCTTQKGLSHFKYVCVTIKAVCRSVYECAFQHRCMILNILLHRWPFWNYTSASFGRLPGVVAVLIYSNYTQYAIHEEVCIQLHIKKNTVFPAKENKILTHIQEAQYSFLSASHV